MNELMRILYDYASRYRLSSSIEDCDQYAESTKISEYTLKVLQSSLNEEENQQLENYLGEQQIIHDLDLEAMFCTGFSIGQELSRQ